MSFSPCDLATLTPQVNIANLHVRYEDDSSPSADQHSAVGCTMEKLTVRTCDENWERVWHNIQRGVHGQARRTDAAPERGPRCPAHTPREAWAHIRRGPPGPVGCSRASFGPLRRCPAASWQPPSHCWPDLQPIPQVTAPSHRIMQCLSLAVYSNSKAGGAERWDMDLSDELNRRILNSMIHRSASARDGKNTTVPLKHILEPTSAVIKAALGAFGMVETKAGDSSEATPEADIVVESSQVRTRLTTLGCFAPWLAASHPPAARSARAVCRVAPSFVGRCPLSLR